MARWKPEESSKKLAESVQADNHRATKELCLGSVQHLRRRAEPCPEEPAKEDLSTLGRRRFFVLIVGTVDAFIPPGLSGPEFRRQYAQAHRDRYSFRATRG